MASNVKLEHMHEKKVSKFIASHPNFHLVLDNDMFFLYSKRPPNWETSTEKEYDSWEKSVKILTVYSSPTNLIDLLVAMLGGTVDAV